MKILIDTDLLLPIAGFSRYKESFELLREILISEDFQLESYVLDKSVKRIILLLENKPSLDDESLRIALNSDLENLKIKKIEAPPSIMEKIEKKFFTFGFLCGNRVRLCRSIWY
jgi:hypothetical protein